MPTEYVVLIVGGNKRNSTPMRILTNRITKLEKLQEVSQHYFERV